MACIQNLNHTDRFTLPSLERQDEHILITCSDEGPGIPASQRRKVFEPFTQVAESQTQTTTGAGIGLAVVAELVAAHRGRVWVEDGANGRGTRVVIELPALSASATDTAGPTPSTDDAAELVVAR